MFLEDVKIIQLPKIEDQRGNLSFLESNNHIPFKIKRTYWIYDVPGGYARGGHAFLEQHEFIIALSGGFDVVVDDRNPTFALTCMVSITRMVTISDSNQHHQVSSITIIIAINQFIVVAVIVVVINHQS